MGVNTSEGAGPMYAMSLAMVQEYFHLDWQMFAAMGSHESMAGLELYENLGSKPGKVVGVKFGKASGFGGNNDEQLGTMHYLTPSYKAYAYQSYPEFFPYDLLGGNPSEFFKTPDPTSKGTTALGWCAGNSATIASVTLINSLYCWWGFDVMYNATSFDYRKMNDGAKDYEWAAKMFMSAWNGGWGKLNADATTLFGVPEDPAKVASFKADSDVSDNVAQSIYVKKVYQTVPLLTGANKNSVLNGGECAVYDTTISLEKVAEFFFGINRDWDGNVLGTSLQLAESGKLGIQGVLNHFRLKDDKRLQLWNDVKMAYNLMKNRAPSSKGTDMISLRYDFLTILRVAKQYLILEMPIPVHSEFKTKVAELSKVNNIENADPTDNIYPKFKVDYSNFGFDAEGNFFIELDAKDNGVFDVNPGKPIEWTVDEYWNDWREGTAVKIDTAADKSCTGRFRVVIPHAVYKEEFGTKRVGYGWARVSDKNRNSTIQEFVIPAIKYPRFRKAYAKDRNGDGVGDSLIVELIPAEDKEKFYAIDAFDSIAYSWPEKTPIKNKKDAEKIVKQDSLIAIVDGKLTGGTGEGSIFGRYPLDIAEYKIDTISSTFAGVISDSVGPAIRTAALNIDKNRAKDTLVLTVSEPIVLKLDGTDPYVILKKGDVETAIASDLIEKISDTEFRFIFDKTKKVSEQEMVKFVFTGTTVTDVKGNRPISINQWVPISQKGDKDASVESSSIFDRNGDGYGDSVFVQFKLGSDLKTRFTTDSIKTNEYSWPSNSMFDPIDSKLFTKISESALGFTGIKNLAGFGEGALKFGFPESKTVKGIILDKVGAALRDTARFSSASLDRKSDTLMVKLTELLDNALLEADHGYVQFADDTLKPAELNCALVRVISADSAELIFNKDQFAATSYKWVRLKSENGAYDLKGNKPASNSKWVPIVRIGTGSTLDGSAIFDTKGDGKGSLIRVEFTEGSSANSPKLANLKSIIYQWPSDAPSDTATASELKIENGVISFNTKGSRAGFGTGTVSLVFADTTLICSITDSVGPAVSTAVKLWSESNENDTVVVTATESLKNSFASDSAFTVIIRGTAETAVKSKTATYANDTLKLVFPFGMIQESDSIAFIAKSGVADLAGNIPLEQNQHVEIAVVGGKKPSFVHGEMFDIDGNGTADSAEVTIRPGTHAEADNAKNILSAKASWPTKTALADVKSAAVSETVVKLTEMNFTGTAGTGSSELTFPSGTVRGDLADKVGPVIVSAKLWEPMGGNDTLQVEFSEPILGASDGAELLNINGTAVFNIKAEPYLNSKIWRFTFNRGTVEPGDSVNIRFGSSIADTVQEVNNPAHRTNRKVEITMKQRPIAIVTAESGFFDTDANGAMDLVKIKLAKEADAKRIEQFSAAITWPNLSGSVDTIRVKSNAMTISGGVIEMVVNSVAKGITSVDGSRYGTIVLSQPDDDQVVPHTTTFVGKDFMAPVLVNTARYTGKKLTSDEEQFEDELVLNYSEPIKKIDLGTGSDLDIYTLTGRKKGAYSIGITGESIYEGSVVKQKVRVIRNQSIIPATGDSIAIKANANGKVIDEQGNVQREQCSFVPFTTVTLPAEYSVTIYPNPFTIDADMKNELLSEYGNGGEYRGLLGIVVRPYGNRAGENLSGVISLFDAVGHTIVNREPLIYQESGSLLVALDGTNQRGREIGSGLYRGVIEVTSGTDDSKQMNVIPVMIGIQHSK